MVNPHEIGDLIKKNKGAFDKYCDLLLRWNKTYNLTTITERNEVFEKHFWDSAAPIGNISDNASLLDIGAGAGFPGIPLKIVFPALSVTLLEATRKKCNFCEAVILELGLKNIRVVHGRVEDKEVLKQIGRFDIVISRATLSTEGLIKVGKPYLKERGALIAMKGKKETEQFGLKGLKIEEYTLPGGAKRSLIIYSPQ